MEKHLLLIIVGIDDGAVPSYVGKKSDAFFSFASLGPVLVNLCCILLPRDEEEQAA
jgi:hypothetical protein